MRIRMWVLALLCVYGFSWGIGADKNVRTERISGTSLFVLFPSSSLFATFADI